MRHQGKGLSFPYGYFSGQQLRWQQDKKQKIQRLATDLCDEIVVLSDGRLSRLDHSLLDSPDFEARLIELLKDENAHD